jgi:rRNA maturation RNase YbeY
MNKTIFFHSEEIDFKLKKKKKVRNWLIELANTEEKTIEELSYIFCSDEYLLEVNKEHLDHDYFTDVITFDYCDNKVISGDIFISIDRVMENALIFDVSFSDELHRVIIHGILHYCGFQDKSPQQKEVMRSKEDFYLNLR